jgi:hypothetical protein
MMLNEDTGIVPLYTEAGDPDGGIHRIDKDATIRINVHDTTDDLMIDIGYGTFVSIEMTFEQVNALIHSLQLVMADRLSPHGQLEKEQARDRSRAHGAEFPEPS